MTQADRSLDALPTVPRRTVRVAEGPHENLYALGQAFVGRVTQGVQAMDDETLVSLMMEPGFLEGDGPEWMARELLVRLSARIEAEQMGEAA